MAWCLACTTFNTSEQHRDCGMTSLLISFRLHIKICIALSAANSWFSVPRSKDRTPPKSLPNLLSLQAERSLALTVTNQKEEELVPTCGKTVGVGIPRIFCEQRAIQHSTSFPIPSLRQLQASGSRKALEDLFQPGICKCEISKAQVRGLQMKC